MVVHVEYFIYNTMGMIGSVGGTFGMFIGFSVTGFISSATKYLQQCNCKHKRNVFNSEMEMTSNSSDGNSVDIESDE